MAQRDSPKNVRTPLRNVSGREELRGDPAIASQLARSFRILERERDLPIRGVHGIHPYPGRLHPAWVSRLLEMVAPDARVYDPFCGSGTALVEALLSGRRCFGGDVNGIAVRIARLRTQRRSRGFIDAFAVASRRVHELAANRRETPLGVLAKGERAYPPHVLTQLINLRSAIELEHSPELKEALLLTLSPLLAKFAARPGRPAPRVGRRAVRDRFLKRCEGTAEAWADFAREVPEGLPDPDIRVVDALKTDWPPGSADVVISSPPYPGVYDYAAEQVRRSRWLDEPLSFARDREIGRRGSPGSHYVEGLYRALKDMVRVVRQGGSLFLVLGDGADGSRAVRADQVLRKLLHSRDLHLKRTAMVSQERPHFHGPSSRAFAGRPRREHLVMLERP